MGIVYGWMFARTGSLLPGMLAHFLHNSACAVLSRMDSIPGVPAQWVAFDRYDLLPAGTVLGAAALAAASVLAIRRITRPPREGRGARPEARAGVAGTATRGACRMPYPNAA